MIKRLRFWLIPLKGPTAYEWQRGGVVLRVCHLRGPHWSWRPWRRIKVQYFKSEVG